MNPRQRLNAPPATPKLIVRAVQSALLGLMAAHAAQAQTSSPSTVIEVTGLRASLESAL